MFLFQEIVRISKNIVAQQGLALHIDIFKKNKVLLTNLVLKTG
jgi:hypothetical protein